MATYTLTIPAPAKVLSANNTLHWGAKSRIVKAWRDATFVHATKARLPKGLTCIGIHLDLWFPTNQHRDRENYYTALKPVVDGLKSPERPGLAGYGLISDDTPTYLRDSTITLHEGRHPEASVYGLAVVTIKDLSEETP